MTKLLLSIHVLAAIIAIGPVTVAASMFPATTRRAVFDRSDPRGVAVLRNLHRICRVYAALGVLVPVFGLATASSLGVLGDTWLIISMILTAAAAAILAFLILPGQAAALAGLSGEPTPPVHTAASANLAEESTLRERTATQAGLGSEHTPPKQTAVLKEQGREPAAADPARSTNPPRQATASVDPAREPNPAARAGVPAGVGGKSDAPAAGVSAPSPKGAISAGAIGGRAVARLGMVTGVFNLLWAIVVVLMIVRPGSTTGV